VPTPIPPPTTTLPGTSRIAVLVAEAVIPVSGTASSEVFVSLVDVQQGVRGFELHISFDPEIVRVLDADDVPANGVQIADAPFFDDQVLDANQVDNATGEIVFALTQREDAPLRNTSTWAKVATITWVAQREGKSVVTVERTTQFKTADGQLISPDAAHHGFVFARMPGTIKGIVELQGREGHRGALVFSSLAAARVDRGSSDSNGQFEITTSHGEGFYTVSVSMPGYLSAESDRPIKVIVGSASDVGKVVLYGGDVNDDNCIDIRDLSYVAWHFDEYATNADVNGDEQVDILDLSLTAANFGQCGPTTWEIPDQDR
jgi:hypothetical protein